MLHVPYQNKLTKKFGYLERGFGWVKSKLGIYSLFRWREIYHRWSKLTYNIYVEIKYNDQNSKSYLCLYFRNKSSINSQTTPKNNMKNNAMIVT